MRPLIVLRNQIQKVGRKLRVVAQPLKSGCAACVLMVSAPPPCVAQWALVGGPQGSEVTAIAAAGSLVYAGTGLRGVFRSQDGGSTWTRLPSGPKDTRFRALAVTSSTVLAGTATGLFRSGDRGESWQRVKEWGGDTAMTAFVVGGNGIFAIGGPSAGSRLHRSTDEGETWAGVDFGSMGHPAACVAVDGAKVFVSDDWGAIYRSPDGGESWEKLDSATGDPIFRKSVPFQLVPAGGRLFAVSERKLHVSSDDGSSWSPIELDSTAAGVVGLVAAGGRMFLPRQNRIYRSTDGGATWARSDSGFSSQIYGVAAGQDGVLLGASTGVFRTPDGGDTWVRVSVGLSHIRAMTLAAAGGHVFAGTGFGVVTRSSDRGETWASLTDGMPPEFFRSVPGIALLDSTLFVATEAGGVYRSTDLGATFDSANTGLRNPGRAWIFAKRFVSQGPYIFVGTGVFGVYRSSDGGLTWNQGANAIPSVPYAPSVSALCTHGSSLLAGTMEAGIFRSRDYGDTWTAVNTGMPRRDGKHGAVLAFAAIGTRLFAATGEGVYRTTDDGDGWTSVNSWIEGFSETARLGVHAVAASGERLFAANDSGVFHSSDFGETWRRSNLGLADLRILSLAVDDRYLYAAADRNDSDPILYGGGVWRRPLSEFPDSVPVSQGEAADSPQGSGFGIGWGGMVRPGAMLEFALQRGSRVNLSLFDPAGRLAATLLDGGLPPGRHRIRLPEQGLADGLYFLRLQGTGFSRAAPIVLNR